ncbi:reverse transcriptase family protein [Arenimonas sp.]|uniref:reverse transcriptase family protein n=1 Tax=Arenimonas sp. TaxID=1872635 RepID=UPI002E35760B|nr:reverse transcriptase family protein [Arenimonas sp.]HEX4853055.1 reverse transcriptase family protein [Arenimonas sp.]
MSRRITQYPAHQSPFFRVASKRKLAHLFGLTVPELEALLRHENYNVWPTQQKLSEQLAGIKPRKSRTIQHPKSALFAIHARLASLLAKIEKPSFVKSATRGVSYLDNATAHTSPGNTIKVDIKNFYPSVTKLQVKKFFKVHMQCPGDVADLIARTCCLDGKLPTGSPLSPILSYFACSDLFLEIRDIAAEHDLNFTLYVDDMTFTGAKANRAFASRVNGILKRHGFVGHKAACIPDGEPKVITGVALIQGERSLPFSRQRRARMFETAFWRAADEEGIRLLGTALIGQFREAARVEPGIEFRAAPILDRMQTLGITPGKKAPGTKKKRRRTRSHRVSSIRGLVSQALKANAPVQTPHDQDTSAGREDIDSGTP